MSEINTYLSDLNKLIEDLPFKTFWELKVDNRGDIVLYIKGKIIFSDASELHFKEYCMAVPVLQKIAYSYHYQDQNKELIFRYDNAEHHPEIATYPHHKHLRDKVLPSQLVSLKEVLNQVISKLAAEEKWKKEQASRQTLS